MYTAINLTDKTSITTTSKSTLCKFIGINPTTLWRQLGKSSYLEYKEYSESIKSVLIDNGWVKEKKK